MATRRPLVIVSGVVQELPSGDALPAARLPALDSGELNSGIAFIGDGLAVARSGQVFRLTEGAAVGEWWFPMTLEAQLDMPEGIWSDVSGASDGLNSAFFFSHVDGSFDTVLRIAKADLSASIQAPVVLMDTPAALPAVPGSTAECGHVTLDGAHFYVGIGSDLYHIVADSPGVISSSSTVEGATLALPGGAATDSVLVSPDGTTVLALGSGSIHRFLLSTPYSLASASSLGTVTLNPNHEYHGASYFYPYEYFLVHRGGFGLDATELVETATFGDITSADYAGRMYLPLLTEMPEVVVSDIPPMAVRENQLWLDIS